MLLPVLDARGDLDLAAMLTEALDHDDDHATQASAACRYCAAAANPVALARQHERERRARLREE
jgi:hypothetical protein